MLRFGQRRPGKRGTSAPPAAIANAVADALSPLGDVRVNEIPLTPERVLRMIQRARGVGRP